MNNKIKHLNGNVFDNTYALMYAFFEENECIDQNFLGYNAVANMKETITEKMWIQRNNRGSGLLNIYSSDVTLAKLYFKESLFQQIIFYQ